MNNNKIKVTKCQLETCADYRMWIGWCIRCGTEWQFWFFGATLGFGLEHQRRCTVSEKKYRDAVTGEYVTQEYAEANPDTTVEETDE